MENIVISLLQFRDQLKIYHWQTKTYSRHIATDKLICKVSKHTDRIVEIMQGARETRFKLGKDTIILSNYKDKEIVFYIIAFRNWLNTKFEECLTKVDHQVEEIKDELVNDINQTLYLFSQE